MLRILFHRSNLISLSNGDVTGVFVAPNEELEVQEKHEITNGQEISCSAVNALERKNAGNTVLSATNSGFTKEVRLTMP